jgi:hypothetical protein
VGSAVASVFVERLERERGSIDAVGSVADGVTDGDDQSGDPELL